MNPKLLHVLLVGAAVVIFALSCVLLSRGRRSPSCESQPRTEQETGSTSQSLVFADLTPAELAQVVRYLQGHLGLRLVDAAHANPSDNCIASVELQVPAKAEVLQFLDGAGARPPREALAVLYFGDQPDPNVTEYVVGPLPTPAYHRDVTVRRYGGKVPYHRRPMLGTEYEQVGAFLKTVAFAAAPTFLKEVLEYDSTNVAFQSAAPHGFQSGDRKSWFALFQNVSGFFVHPVGLEVLVDHSSLDTSRWANLGSPLRRHYSNLQSLYYGGLVNSALVVRSIATVSSHDYVWDFIFYQNGAIEGKVQATGYASSSFLYGDGLRYGNRVWDHTLGTIRTHFINYKVDLDVGGVKNSLVAHDMAFEVVRAPWNPEQQIERPRLTKKVLDTEDQAAFRLQAKMPRYIYFAANSKNKWGHQRGYRIQVTSSAGDHVPEASSMERAISWARYQLAVTRRKEEEPTSTSIYNQNDPWTPTVAFADFINNETITNEDLVAWITAGFLHIPHSEDIPNTVTVGNSVGFLLRPYNYYDLDPSIYSHDGVFFTSEQDFTACEVNPVACLPQTASCLPNFPPFTYDGFQNM
ncbi:AOC2 oxidase, partial [Probosciger aterrimus]|nr:AOC2 oxidase [Probosciger aterrimus]